MSACKYSLVAGLFNQKSPVPKASGQLSSYSSSQGIKAAHSTSSKRKMDDQNISNVDKEIIDQIVTEKESSQALWPTFYRKIYPLQ